MRYRSLGISLAKLSLLGVSAGITFLICEILVRMLGYAALYDVYSNPEMLWQHDEVLGWSHEPDSSAEYIGPRPWPIEFRSQVEINSQGLRGPEPTSLPPDGLRVLFLGDSMVAGFEVEYEETFVALLEDQLASQLELPIQVVNGGVRGYGTDQSFLYFRERGYRQNPHLILLWLSENDLVDDVTLHRMRRVFGKPAFVDDGQGRLRLVASPVPLYPECSELRIDDQDGVVRVDSLGGRFLCRLQLALFDRSALFSFVTTLIPWDRWGTLLRDLYYLGMPAPTTEATTARAHSREPITGLILDAFAEEARNRGARFAVVATPGVIDKFAAAGIVLDPARTLTLDTIEAADPSIIQFKHDSHYTPKGHRIVTDQLSELVAPILRDIASTRTRSAEATN